MNEKIGLLFAKYCDVKDLQPPHYNALSREGLEKLLADESFPLEAVVIKTEADTVNTVSANQRAKRWAMMNFDKWNEVTGFVDPHISYYDEITALIEDAVEFGYGVALKQPLKEIMKVIKKSEGSL